MTQKLTLLSSRLRGCLQHPGRPMSTLFPRQQCPGSSQILLSHPTYCHPCPADTKQHTALPSSLSEHSGCVSAASQLTLGEAETSAYGTGTLPQPGVSPAGPRQTGLWASPMSPSQCKPSTDRTVRALGFSATTRPPDLHFPGVGMFLLRHFKSWGPDAVGRAGVSRAVLRKATATNLPAEHRLHRHWEILLETR